MSNLSDNYTQNKTEVFPIGFIEQIAPIIQKYAPTYGIHVCSPIIAQAILESASGTSELAKNAHNYFGLKYRAGRCPTSCGIYNKIGSEQNQNGSYTSSSMQWMKFPSMEAGVQGYFDFINIANYSNLKGVSDPKTYLENIKKDGYATSLKYVENVLSVINRYDLSKYDQKEAIKQMTYSNSKLVTYTRISPNKTIPRNHTIDTITIHCYVGQVTAKSGCNAGKFIISDPQNGTSCNYVVGYDGSIGLCVEEKDRSWCSSNRANDHRAVTIEVACEAKHPYMTTEKALSALIELVADICRRNKKKKLIWFGDKNRTLAYKPKDDEMVMTVHRWFAPKACPGSYLYEKHSYIAEQVNKKLNQNLQNQTSKFIYKNVDYTLVFDSEYYSNSYPDLRNAFGLDSAKLFDHFCNYGMKEGRIASPSFHVNRYKSYYADLRNAFGDNLPLYYEHYINYGHKENRKCV